MSESGAPTGKWPTLPPHLTEPTSVRPMGRVALTVRRPDAPEVEIEIEKEEFVIGRKAADVDLALDDDLVSRKHALLTFDTKGYFKLADLGSKNGIEFSGRTVRRLNLVDGDEFSIGKTNFVFHAEMRRLESIEAAPKAPPPRSESVFGDVEVPMPKGDASILADADDVGWDPAAVRPSEPAGPELEAPAPSASPAAPEGAEDPEEG